MMNRGVRGLVALVLFASVSLVVPAPSGAQVEGAGYVSPSFGYRFSWDASWWVDDEDAIDGVDYLSLTNGSTYVEVTGTDVFGGRTRPCVSSARSFASSIASNGQAEVLRDANLQPIESYEDDRAFLALSLPYPLEDGSTFDLGMYVECRVVVPGFSVVQFAATAPLDVLLSTRADVEALIARVVMPSAGEVGPVFAAGPWRVSVVAVQRDFAFPALGLEAKEGKRWLVVAADVTNWGDQDAVFPTGGLRVSLADGSKPARLAPASTAKAARALESEPRDPQAGVPIAIDETTRVVLAFQVSASYPEPALLVDDQRLLLTPITPESDGSPTELPGVVVPPFLTRATVDFVADGSHIVVADSIGAPRRLALLGIETPEGGDCFADEAATRLADLAGETVWIETDPSETETDGVYLWRARGDGSFRLINQELVSGGFGVAIPEEGRFSAWLQATNLNAESSSRGLWSACTDIPGTDQPDSETIANRTQAATVTTAPAAAQLH